MKKITSIICAAAVFANLAALTGCSVNEGNSDGSGISNTSLADTDGNSGLENSGVSGASDNSDNSNVDTETQKPEGEPTFLTCPDGAPIYTSEITEVWMGSDQYGDKKSITFAEAEHIARESGDFTVKCDGFVYGYIPEPALNRIDDPEMFSDIGGGSFDYLGETFDVNTCEGKCSTEFMRINAGDKFDTLTVKSAYSLFGSNYSLENGFSDVPGAYLIGGAVEFEGDIELYGYVCVTQTNTLYGTGGDMTFYADGDSSVKVPNISSYFWDHINNRRCRFSTKWYDGYFGDGVSIWNLGNIYEVSCDVSELSPGDSFVKVKITVGDIKFINDSNRPVSECVLKDLKVV